MIHIFGVSSTAIYDIFKSAAATVEGVSVLDIQGLNDFLKFAGDRTGAIYILGCDFAPFEKGMMRLFSDAMAFRGMGRFSTRGLICCDLAKASWQRFLTNEELIPRFFNKVYALDLPHPSLVPSLPGAEAQHWGYLTGLPIEQYMHPERISKDRFKLFTFAGNVEDYPLRREALERIAALPQQIDVFRHPGANAIQVRLGNPYSNYIDFLMHSAVTLNFSQSIVDLDGRAPMHVKGRFWECLATGTVLMEEKNPMLDCLDLNAQVLNFAEVEQIPALLADFFAGQDLDTLIARKRERIAQFSALFQNRRFFAQLQA